MIYPSCVDKELVKRLEARRLEVDEAMERSRESLERVGSLINDFKVFLDERESMNK